MARKATKAILALLKRLGVEIEDLDKVKDELDDLEFDVDELVGEGHVLLSVEEHRDLKNDLTKLRRRMKEAETRADEAEEAANAGDSLNKTKATKLQARVDELEPLVSELLGLYETTWSEAAGSIPEKLKPMFTFAEEGKELDQADLIKNVKKLTEYRQIGALEAPAAGEGEGEGEGEGSGEGEGAGSTGVRTGSRGKKLTPEQLATMTAAEKLEHAYQQGGSTSGT